MLEKSREFSFVLIYISPSCTFGQIHCELKILLALLKTTKRTIICGDFNVDACTSTKNCLQLKSVKENYGFTNVNLNRSHKLGSCLDHIYLSNDFRNSFYHCVPYPTYYSDHYIVLLQLQRQLLPFSGKFFMLFTCMNK